MICPKCHSENVSVQTVAVTKNKHHGLLWWVFIGCWWVFIKWLLFTLPALIIKIFAPKKTKTKIETYCVCQSCGHTWKCK